MLNDSKYGISMEENRLELSLLRASAAPEMRADNGKQRFTYAFMVWDGSFENSTVVQDAISLNDPLKVVTDVIGVAPVFSVDASNIILDTMKLAEDGSGDIIMRMYESKHCDTMAHICIGICGLIRSCNILEEEQNEQMCLRDIENGQEIALHFDPFQLRTLRIKRH